MHERAPSASVGHGRIDQLTSRLTDKLEYLLPGRWLVAAQPLLVDARQGGRVDAALEADRGDVLLAHLPDALDLP